MQKTFRAVPLSDLTSPRGAVCITAENDLAALLQAKRMLGDETPFDLSEGARLVAVYRPTMRFRSVRLASGDPS